MITYLGMIKVLLLFVVFHVPFSGSTQPEKITEYLSRIKSIPYWYTEDASISGDKDYSKVDPLYKRVAQRGNSHVITLLRYHLLDTTSTLIKHPCDTGYLTYSELAFIIINDIEPFPLFLITKTQWDVFGTCGIIPDGFFQYLKHNQMEFFQRFDKYFVSVERERYLKEMKKAKE